MGIQISYVCDSCDSKITNFKSRDHKLRAGLEDTDRQGEDPSEDPVILFCDACRANADAQIKVNKLFK